MGGLVKTILDLKAKVETLEKKGEGNQMDEIEKINEKQRINDEAIAANTDAISKIDKELRALEEKIHENQRTNDEAIAANKEAITKIDKELPALEEKINEKQRINDKAIAANTNAITKIDKKLRALEGKKRRT